MSEQNEPTAEEIVEWLQSSDPTERSAALDELLCGVDGGAVLITVGNQQAQVTASGAVDAGRMFNVLLSLTQQFGAAVGLQLQWVQAPDDPKKIVVPPGTRFFQ